MVLVFYVLLVWAKIVVGTSIVFLALWWVRDRGFHAGATAACVAGAIALWAAPWAWFLWSQADLYQGHCGLRQGVRDCDLPRFLWERMRWLRLGASIDVALLIGVIALVFRARLSSDETRLFWR